MIQRMTRAAVVVGALAAFPAFVLAQQSADSKYNIAVPTRSSPWMAMDQSGGWVRCDASPWQDVDLGTVNGKHISMGDHCAKHTDPVFGMALQAGGVLTNSCDLQNICYAVPGNTKTFCDDMVKWQWDRDCTRNYPLQLIARQNCQSVSITWRSALDTGISAQYWDRSQVWGNQHCVPLTYWVPMSVTGVMPAGAIYSGPGTADPVCRVTYQGGVHAGRVKGTNCDIGYGGAELTLQGAQILVIRTAYANWVAAGPQGEVPAQAVYAGFADGAWRAVCRGVVAGGPMRAGKFVGGHCNIGYGGKEISVRPFQVLTVH